MAAVTGTAHEISASQMHALVPVLKLGGEGITRGLLDPAAARLDGHALMMGYTRGLRAAGGQVVTDAEVLMAERRAGQWHLRTSQGDYNAPVLVNAAGAWADELARLAGVATLGLTPLRRTIISFQPPSGVDVRGWPLVRSLANEFYFLPEAGHLLASPADETASPPCDAQPEEYDIALAAWRIEEVTTMAVRPKCAMAAWPPAQSCAGSKFNKNKAFKASACNICAAFMPPCTGCALTSSAPTVLAASPK
jgi:D-arginine dehydrogenase